MFTLEQIASAHSKVKSGADFPQFVQDLKGLGVASYTTYVSDGRAEYIGEDGSTLGSGGKYPAKQIAQTSDGDRFVTRLKIHQNGETDYPTFCRDAAETGVDRWITDTAALTCTYYDRAGVEILAEEIPAA